MDATAVPTYVAASHVARDARRRPGAMSEEQVAFARAMGLRVPPEDEPPALATGHDGLWTPATVHSAARIVPGDLFHVAYRLVVPKNALRGDNAAVHARLVEAVRPVHESISKWNADSELSRLNAEHSLAQASPLFLQALKLACSVNGLDPTVAPLLQLWKDALQNKGQPPDPAAVEELKSRSVGRDKMINVTGSCVQLAASAKLDLDCIAKGFAVDFVADMLEAELNLESYFFDWGGEGACCGQHPAGRPWSIGIVAPPSLHEIFLSWRDGVAPQSFQSLHKISHGKTAPRRRWATSGDYFQMEKFGYCHIVNPATGSLLQASDSTTASVTVFGGSSTAVCDALASAAMVLSDPHAAHAWLHSIKDAWNVSEFYVTARNLRTALSHSTEPKVRVSNPDAGLSGRLGSPYVTLTFQSTSFDLCTARVASVSPPIVSILLDSHLVLPNEPFTLQGHSCRVLHGAPPLLFCSVSTSSSKETLALRRQLDATAQTRIRLGGCDMIATSLACVDADALCAFNVQSNSQFAVVLANEHQGARIEISVGNSPTMQAVLRDKHDIGDHVVVLCDMVN